MSHSVVEKKLETFRKLLLQNGGLADFTWGQRELAYPYYRHFGDEDVKVQGDCLLIFYGMLDDWLEGLDNPFEYMYDGAYYESFPHFAKAYLHHYSSCARHYPQLTALICETLRRVQEEGLAGKHLSVFDQFKLNHVKVETYTRSGALREVLADLHLL